MKHTNPIVISALLAAFALAAPPAAAKKIKCWKNSDGVRECGYVVPPEYSKKGHRELNAQGVEVGRQARAKTPEELAAARKAKRERAEKDRLAKKQAKQDKILLDTFASEDDLRMTLNGKIKVIDSRTQHSRGRIKKLQGIREKLEDTAAAKERAGEKVPQNLFDQISDVDRQLSELDSFIAKSRLREKELREKFADDLKRYRELKGIASQ